MDEAESGSQPVRDLATVLPFIAIALLCPPIVVIFSAPATVGGVPLIIAYVFSVWLAIVLTALFVARRLSASSDAAEDGGPSQP